MYSDIALQVAIKFNELPAEKQILIMQSILIIAEVIAFFYIKHITKTNQTRPNGIANFILAMQCGSSRVENTLYFRRGENSPCNTYALVQVLFCRIKKIYMPFWYVFLFLQEGVKGITLASLPIIFSLEKYFGITYYIKNFVL